jgi:hypothetical protein
MLALRKTHIKMFLNAFVLENVHVWLSFTCPGE